MFTHSFIYFFKGLVIIIFYNVKLLFILDILFITYKAQKAANLQNDEDQTVGTEVSDIGHRRKRKRNPKYVTESSEDECNLHYNVKRSNKLNQLLPSDSENEEMQEEDLKAKVAALLSKKDDRKPQVSQNTEDSIVITSKNLIKTLDSKKDCYVGLNNTTESHSRSKEIYKVADVSHATTEAITPMSFPSTSASPPQFHPAI